MRLTILALLASSVFAAGAQQAPPVRTKPPQAPPVREDVVTTPAPPVVTYAPLPAPSCRWVWTGRGWMQVCPAR